MKTKWLNVLIIGAVAYTIPSLTWYFSTRRKLFIRVFVPKDELKVALRGLPDDVQFRRSFRTCALLQLVVATVVLVAVIVVSLLNPR